MSKTIANEIQVTWWGTRNCNEHDCQQYFVGSNFLLALLSLLPPE